MRRSARNDREASASPVSAQRIERLIFVVRERKIILDADLATLYGVETGSLNRAIKRNKNRFPEDFAFQLRQDEWADLICQFGISNTGRGGRRHLPNAFTEHGVVMAANVLRSARAVSVSIDIVRAFVQLRQVLAAHKEMAKELADLRGFMLKRFNATDREFKRVWLAIEKLGQPPTENERRRIGFDTC